MFIHEDKHDFNNWVIRWTHSKMREYNFPQFFGFYSKMRNEWEVVDFFFCCFTIFFQSFEKLIRLTTNLLPNPLILIQIQWHALKSFDINFTLNSTYQSRKYLRDTFCLTMQEIWHSCSEAISVFPFFVDWVIFLR